MRWPTLLIPLALLTIPSPCFSATGDVLFECTFEESGADAAAAVTSCGGNPGSMNDAATIVTGGHDGGKAVNYYYPNLGNEVVKSFTTSALNKNEITITYWEKFNVAPSLSSIWNVKSVRPYIGSGGNDYFGALLSLWGGGRLYQSPMGGGTATLTIEESVQEVKLNEYDTDYCDFVSGDTYTCPYVHMALSWTPGFGTSWHKIAMYLKVPSSTSSTDGAIKVWIDGVLIYSIANMPPSSLWTSGWTSTIKNVSFHPSDDFFTGGEMIRF